MPSPATCPIADADAALAAQRAAIAALETRLWARGFDAALLPAYQAAHRELERLIAARGEDARHRFVVVVPVADRPAQLRTCLDSLLELCAAYGYGGRRDGIFAKVSVLIADDSREAASLAAHRDLACEFSARGLATRHFGHDEQRALLDGLDAASRAALGRVLGRPRAGSIGHKGQGVMRNIAYLWLAREVAAGERVLIHSIDSDQEFRIKVATADGDIEPLALAFLHRLDEAFATSDALVLTGKVVGDPPVSPAVMTSNFLEDVLGFVREIVATDPASPCVHHVSVAHREGEAAYHDMADLFGFRPAAAPYRYLCPLHGVHDNADCCAHFASRLGAFFYGEHPTRVSYYRHEPAAATSPARTVYAGNYVFRPEALPYFIPFADLRLRMSGPTLGRLIKAEIGPRFVSANLPMLHNRTVRATGVSEFRPGVEQSERHIDLSDEFERQFYGDVMLFSIERLAGTDFADADATLDAVHAEMRAKYNARQAAIVDKLAALRARLDAPDSWWRAAPAAHADFAAFADNVERNFGAASPAYARINDAAAWAGWRTRLLEAVRAYPEDRRLWQHLLAATARQA